MSSLVQEEATEYVKNTPETDNSVQSRSQQTSLNMPAQEIHDNSETETVETSLKEISDEAVKEQRPASHQAVQSSTNDESAATAQSDVCNGSTTHSMHRPENENSSNTNSAVVPHESEPIPLTAPVAAPVAAPVPIFQTDNVPDESTAKERQKRVRIENMRVDKWLKMYSNWTQFSRKNFRKIKSRCRKGIPDSVRARAWPLLVGSQQRMEHHAGLYAKMLRQPAVGDQLKTIDEIERDIYRTFPQHALFSIRGGIGQTSLLRVLRAYAMYDPEIGYCQGMGFITAVLLSYMPEEEAFFLLLSIMQYPPYQIREMFAPGLPEVPILHYQLMGMIRLKLPKLYSHFYKNNIDTSMFATQWFLTIFTSSLPFTLVVRIWDAFLFEGWKVVFRVALAILQSVQNELLKRPFEGILVYFRELPSCLDVEKVLHLAFTMTLKRKQLQFLRDQYFMKREAERTGVSLSSESRRSRK